MPKMKINKKIQGKKARESGQRFELKVRKDLESEGWIVDRWSNNVAIVGSSNPFEWEGMGKLVPARPGPFNLRTTGFPDFIAFKTLEKTLPKEFQRNKKTISAPDWFNNYIVIGVECKSNGYLTNEEKEKCKWYLENNIFSKIPIASKSKERGKINYKEFENA